MRVERGIVCYCAGLQHHAGDHDLAPVRLGHTDRRNFPHGRMCQQRLLHLARIDIGTAGNDDVLGAVGQREKAVLVQPTDIAGAEPAVLQCLGIGLVVVPVAEHHRRPLGLDLTGFACRPRLAIGLGDPHFHDALRWPDRGQTFCIAWVLTIRMERARQRRDGHRRLALTVDLHEALPHDSNGVADIGRVHRPAAINDGTEALTALAALLRCIDQSPHHGRRRE